MHHPDDETRSYSTDQQEIDRLADRFEVAYRAGDKPSIESYLLEFPGDRDQLFRELLVAEVRLRKAAGDAIDIEDYCRRLPGYQSAVRSVFQESEATHPDGSGLGHWTLPDEFGDYRIIRKIGEGGMGVVYEAEQKSMGNRRRAIKTVKFMGQLDDRALHRFQTEVQAVAQLEHRHIVPVYHVGEESGIHFYVMKFIDGNNLRELVKALRLAVNQNERSTEPIHETKKATSVKADSSEKSTHNSGWSKGDTLASNSVLKKISKEGSTAHPHFVRCFVQMGIQTAEALHHVHEQGIVHRDIKPANLLLDVNGDVWLTDFGLARIRDAPEMTVPGTLLGTYHYMSPEQAMGSKRVIVDHRTDIYSLGVTLYELLTLSRAFPGDSREEILRGIQFDTPPAVRKIASRVPVDLETIVMKAMAKDPNARFQSAAEMAAELKRFRDGKPLSIRPPSPLEKLGYWLRAHRHAAASLAAALAVAFFCSIGFSLLLMQQQAKTEAALESEKQQKNEVEKQKDVVTGLYQQADGLRLAANSLLQLDGDPRLALRLAIEAESRHPSADARDSIMRAIDVGHQARILYGQSAVAPGSQVAFSSDGTKLICSVSSPASDPSLNQPAIVWDPANGASLGRLEGNQPITSAVFSPDDALILTASSPRSPREAPANGEVPPTVTAQLWDATTFRPLVPFQEAILSNAHPGAFGPDGLKIVLPVKDNRAAIYFCAGTRLQVLTGHTDRVLYAAFNHAGDRVVTQSDDGSVRIWDAESGREEVKLSHWQKPIQIDLQWIEFTPDDRRLITGSASRGIELWDLENDGTRINVNREPGSSGSVDGTRDQFLTFGMEDYRTMTRLTIRSANDARRTGELVVNKQISKVVVSPDHRFAAILYRDQMTSFQLWDLENRELIRTFDVGMEVLNDVVFSPDSKLIATSSFALPPPQPTRIRLWHVEDGRQRSTFPIRTSLKRPMATASPDGTKLSITSNEQSPVGVLCDFAQSKPAMTFEAKIAVPSSGGTRFLSVQQDKLAVHAIDDGLPLGLETFIDGEATSFAINRDGDRVAAYVGGSEVLLWDPENNRRFRLSSKNQPINDLDFQPDGKRLFTLSSDGKVRVWNADRGTIERELNVGGRLIAIEFDPNAKRFAIASDNGIAKLFDIETFEEFRELRSEDVVFNRMRFSSDGKKLFTYHTTQSDSMIQWDLESGSEVARLEIRGTIGVSVHPEQPELLIRSSEEGAFIWQYETDEQLPVTDTPIGAATYSSDGRHFYLASWSPGFYESAKLDEWPGETNAPRVSRWSRDELETEESIEFPFAVIHRILVCGQQVFANTFRCNQVVNCAFDSHQPISTIPGHDGPVSQCLYSPDSDVLITTSWDGNISFWNADEGRLAYQWNHGNPILSADISRDGKHLVTGARDGTCRIWSLERGADQQPNPTSVALSDSPVHHVAFAGDAGRLLALTSDNQAHLIERENGEKVDFDFRAEKVEWAEFSPDGASILVLLKTPPTADRHLVKIIRVDGTQAAELEYAKPVLTSHFHPDSPVIVTATRDGAVSIRNAQSGETEQELSFDAQGIQLAVFDPTGEYLFVRVFKAGTIWRRDKDGKWIEWLTVEDLPVDDSRRHASSPFAPMPTQRLITRRVDTWNWRDWPLNPLDAAKQLPLRQLSDAEKRRFRIQDADRRPVPAQ